MNFEQKEGGRKRAEGAGGHASSPFERELEVGSGRGSDFSDVSRNKQG